MAMAAATRLSPSIHPRFLAMSPHHRISSSLRTYDASLRLGFSSPRLGRGRLFAKDANVSSGGTVESVPVTVAHDLVKAGHRYLDVRTPEEFNDGHPVGATNIPYMFKSLTGMQQNPDFLAEVSSTFKKDEQIIIGCQSGKRSLMAANDLTSVGFIAIIDVSGGFSAWRQDGLPTTHSK